jgi:16S rRNA (guanine(966)-N(2))-methyltransferase RsmD
MRIIAGEFRGRRIKQPASKKVRPTKDRIREAVFNIIAPAVSGSKVLDLFAGSGAYGLEALSRGAEKAVFIEKETESVDSIKENIELLGVEEDSEVITGDVFRKIKELNESKKEFSLIFSDPPYSVGMAKKTLIKIGHYDILLHSGIIIIEHNIEEGLPEAEGDLSLIKTRTYGKTSISIYQKK